jgi:hypothetical protein
MDDSRSIYVLTCAFSAFSAEKARASRRKAFALLENSHGAGMAPSRSNGGQAARVFARAVTFAPPLERRSNGARTALELCPERVEHRESRGNLSRMGWALRTMVTALGAGVLLVVSCSSSEDAANDTGATPGPNDPGTSAEAGADGRATPGPGPGIDGSTPGPDGTTTPGTSKARALTEKLGGAHAGHFLVGMGNDGTASGDDPAYHFDVTLDLHSHYLPGLSTNGGWVTYNKNPDYVAKRINEAKAHGVVPMFTYYGMAAAGDGNVASSLGSATYMETWFKDYAQALASIKASGVPVVMHVEPDFGGYTLRKSLQGGGPSSVPAMVHSANAAECSGLPEDVSGFFKCVVALTRGRAPNAILGFHASAWGSGLDVVRNTDPKLDVVAEANKAVAFFKAVGAGGADFIATDLSDRDAGCYDVGNVKDTKGNLVCDKRTNNYPDETNATLPNFRQPLQWAKALSDGLDLPVIWWQLPFGEPSATPGGTPGHFRDNRTKYVFGHIDEFVAAGGVAAVWGAGAAMQTTFATDNGQYKTAVGAYFAHPFPL